MELSQCCKHHTPQIRLDFFEVANSLGRGGGGADSNHQTDLISHRMNNNGDRSWGLWDNGGGVGGWGGVIQ